MADKVYGICGTNKCKREVIPKEETYTKDQVNNFIQMKCTDLSNGSYFAEIKQAFNGGMSNMYLSFNGEAPILVINCLIGGYSFTSKGIGVYIPTTDISIDDDLLQHISDHIRRYEATFCCFYNGLVFNMQATLTPQISSNRFQLYLEHLGHGESGAYQYIPSRTMTFVFGAIPK